MNRRNNGIGQVWRVMYPVFTYMGIYYVIFILSGVLGMTFSILAFKGSGGGALDYYMLLDMTTDWINRYGNEISGVACLFTLPVVWLFLRSDRRNSGQTLRQYDRVPFGFYLAAFVLGAASCLAINSLMSLSGLMTAYEENLTQVAAQLYRGHIVIEVIAIGILSPLVEELLFRGLAMNRIKETASPNMAIFMSALFFALYHGNMLQMIYSFILGMILGYVYERFHSLAAPILLHCGANIISVVGSETDVLDRFFIDDSALILYSLVWCMIMLLCIYLIHYRVNPALLHKEREGFSRDSKQ